MNKWIKVPKEEDDCIGLVIHGKDREPYIILATLKNEDEDKVYICATDKGFYSIKRIDAYNWDISSLSNEFRSLIV